MERPTEPAEQQDTVERRQQSAEHVLQAFRERRRQRRGEDTYFGSAECLVEHAESGVEASEVERRRSSILKDAERAGMSRDLAEMLYDVAREEGLDPAIGFELVRCGLGVCPPPEGISTASSAPATDKYLPPWMFPASPPDQQMRERTLHMSFRRLRSLLESTHDVDQAFRQFANEPDVGHCGY